MRPRIAKIGENAVAHILCDKSIEPGHSLGDGTVISADNFAQIFGVEARREFGRAHQIAEHYRELAPLRAVSAWRSRRCRWLWSYCLPDRLATAPAEPRYGLVLKATSWARNRQRRTALKAKAPCPCVFGHAARAAHWEPSDARSDEG